MCYYFIIELIPDRCEHEEISKRQDLWSWICNKFFENCENNRFRYAITVWFFDKTERERAKEDSALEGNSVRINLSPMIAVILLSGTTIVL